MSEIKPTPGPWELWGHANPSQVISSQAGFVAQTLGNNDKANARLIAAAPELLEAAIELKDVCNRPAAARTRAEAWRKLDAAIAKATGDTP